MSDFNRKGTPTSKIMTYDRFHLRKVLTTLKCETEINVYFRINITSGNLYNKFLLISTTNQQKVLKNFISTIYNVSIDKIIIENITLSGINFKAKISNVLKETECKTYNLLDVKNSLVNSMNTVLGTTFTNSDLDPAMTFVKDNNPL